MRILITGSRIWNDRAMIRTALIDAVGTTPAEEVTVVHGNARGADIIAADQAERLGYKVECHPADWNRHGKRAGYIRNAEMVNLGADVCLAFPLGESRGTRMCMKIADRAGIPVRDCSGMHRG